MRTVEVTVERDHLERLATSRSPVLALAELLWNSLDADATEILVSFERNELGRIERICVSDNGHGISHEDAEPAFGLLGGSSKLGRSRTRGGTILHGEQGKGRFQAFALGSVVEWLTRYIENSRLCEYRIRGSRTTLKRFMIEEPQA
jgi:DNA topoisomerase VI subunit B